MQQFDIAFYGFKSKFRQLPGDSNLFTDPGDNDTIIENDMALGAPSGFNHQRTEEKANFWKHLSDSGMLKGNYTNTEITSAPYIYQPGGNAPISLMAKSAVVTLFHSGNFSSPARMFYYISNYDSTGIFTTVQAAAIDTKLDDGLGYGFSSNRKTVYAPGTPACAGSGGPSSGPYELDQPELRCKLAIEVGVATEQ